MLVENYDDGLNTKIEQTNMLWKANGNYESWFKQISEAQIQIKAAEKAYKNKKYKDCVVALNNEKDIHKTVNEQRECMNVEDDYVDNVLLIGSLSLLIRKIQNSLPERFQKHIR